ncbi:MAG: HesA/MoeB/ThiF family protein [Peptococcaceae bacterium]|jgi:adenylyltransferase/sulfurtransferase|nr:HesA/MoeB/ThiF family protein [Peptococcaceae bacterium]
MDTSEGFTSERTKRYSRQIVLPEVGPLGQLKLANASALIAGMGGLGCPAAYYLCAAGVGKIGVIDGDAVDLTNLHRQILHSVNDIGSPKVDSAKEKLNALNPECTVVPRGERLTASNVMEIISGYDIVLDCTDNFATRFLINDACVIAGKPLFYGAVLKFFGQAITILPGKGPCYRCIFNEPPPVGITPTCVQAGIMGVVPGIIGLIQATEALKYLLGMDDLLTGKLLTFDALTMELKKTDLRKNPKCPVCGSDPTINKPVEYELEPCDLDRDGANIDTVAYIAKALINEQTDREALKNERIGKESL